MVKQTVGTMSGGEKARLVLCMIVWQRPNLLLLDEPTNHLDLATREALSMALNEFEGTVMLVSHDRSLLRSVCDEFWLVTRGGSRTDFAGDLDDYQRYLLDEARRNRESLRESARNAKKPASRDAAPVTAGKKTSGNLKALARDQQRIEQSLLVLQAEQRSLEARLAISLSPQDLAVIGRRLEGTC
jgi:ATP-binding cassette subfamily F protein 3